MNNGSKVTARDLSSSRWSKLLSIACVGMALAAAGCGAADPAETFRPDDRDASTPIVDPGAAPEDSDASSSSTDPGADGDDAGGFLAAPCTRESNARFCARLGKNCGTVTARDNCGIRRTVSSCGRCTAPTVCNTNNVCSCTPETDAAFCARQGKQCGAVIATDNCGATRTVVCGTCPVGVVCTANNLCSCTRETDAAFCARQGKQCGTVTAPDNCGVTRTVPSCGTCPSPQVCGANNVCSCTSETDAQFCTRLRANCGVLTAVDNCGSQRSVNCGACPNGQGCCGSNQCIPLNTSPNCGACGVTCDAAHACSNSACRLTDGQRGCATATDCTSGVCSQFFVDADGDAEGDVTKPVNQCGSTPGVGLSRSSDDCCDTNPTVFKLNSQLAPNQGPWFVVPATGACVAGHKPFDYDCDGFETMQDPKPFIGCAGDIDTCGPIGGIFFPTIPPCGEAGTAVACVFIDDGSGCIPFEQFTKIQACR